MTKTHILPSFIKSTLVIFASILCSQWAYADSYNDWHDEIYSASQGLDVCIDSHSESVRGDISEKARAKRAQEAKQACGTLKRVFDNTMLAARSRITGMDRSLARYHKAMLDTFDYVIPEKREKPLDYDLRTAKTKLARHEFIALLQQEGQARGR